MTFLMQGPVLVVVIGILVFIALYFSIERILQFIHTRSTGQKQEIIKLLDMMFVETDEKKITIVLMLASFGVGALFFILFWPNILIGLLVGTIATLGGWTLPKVIIKNMHEKRTKTFVSQMVDGLTIMANGVKSGLSVTQSMERVVENMKPPISQEFSLVLSQIRLGRSVEESLLELSERIPKPDVQMFVTSINILKETGGNLAETFQTIVTTVRERQKLEKKIEAMTAQGLMQGVIMTMVPFGLLGVFLVVDPNYVKPLFNTTLGMFFLVIMLGLQIIGGLVIRKIVRIEV